MKKNEKYDKVIANFDLDFIKNKFDNDNVAAPESLNGENVKNAIDDKEQKIIPFVKTKAFKSAVSLVACVAIVAVSLNFALGRNTQSPPVSDTEIQSENVQFKAFSSAKDIEKYFKSIEKSNSSGDFGFPTSKDTIKGAENAADNSSSETYVQIGGVDEADIIKNDGKYIYTFRNGNDKILIYEPDGKNVKKLSEIAFDMDNGNYIVDFFLYKNNLIVQSNSFNSNYDSFTNIDIYSLSDIKNPKKIHSFKQQGSYVSSRITSDSLLVISNKEIRSRLCKTDKDYLPETTLDGSKKAVEPKDICIVENSKSASYLIVSKLDLVSQKMTAKTKAIAGAGSTVYCNENNLYVANAVFDTCDTAKNDDNNEIFYLSDCNTEIYKLDFKNDIKFIAKATFSGTVNNQFSMDEYNGNFRIATTKYDKNSNQISNVYVLDKDLKKLGETDDFAKGEDIHAVRFSGDTAYVITFEYTDPLFVIDLSNPKKPIIKGSVKISGFSTNLIPIDSDTLLGIGTANDFSNPYARGIKFALFDVSDPQKPTVLDSKTIKNTASEAQDTHKAILVNKSENYFAIPFEYVKANDNGIEQIKAGAIAFEIKDKKISIVKKYSTEIENADPVRSTIVDNVIYTFSDGEFINSFMAK